MARGKAKSEEQQDTEQQVDALQQEAETAGSGETTVVEEPDVELCTCEKPDFGGQRPLSKTWKGKIMCRRCRGFKVFPSQEPADYQGNDPVELHITRMAGAYDREGIRLLVEYRKQQALERLADAAEAIVEHLKG